MEESQERGVCIDQFNKSQPSIKGSGSSADLSSRGGPLRHLEYQRRTMGWWRDAERLYGTFDRGRGARAYLGEIAEEASKALRKGHLPDSDGSTTLGEGTRQRRNQESQIA